MPKPEINLRNWTALVEFDGTPRRVRVVTHIRGPRWLVEGRALPKRFERGALWWAVRRTTVTEDQLTLIAPPKETRVRRQAQSRRAGKA